MKYIQLRMIVSVSVLKQQGVKLMFIRCLMCQIAIKYPLLASICKYASGSK